MSTGIRPAENVLPDVDNHRIDRVCLQFEEACQANEAPRIEDYISGWRGLERSILTRELLLLEVHYLRQRGIEPAAEPYLERFADEADMIADVFGLRRPASPGERSAGDRIGRYVIQRKVGSGSFGTVYQAWDEHLERMVALKIPRAERFEDEVDITLFSEEARTAAQLTHPAIVPVLDVLPGDGGIPVLVLPFIEGCSLREGMLTNPLSLASSVDLLIEIAEAMDYAHRRGFVHRDLEPRNILLDSAGRPHITDFGLAVHESTQEEKAGESAGSLAYMSPEQLRGESHWLDGRSDIWAIGVIMYELLTGRRPFTGRSFDELATEIFAREPKPPRQINSEVPVELEQVCLTCLTKHVANRYATASDLADALRSAKLSFAEGASKSKLERSERAVFHDRRSRLILAAAFVALVGLGTLTAASIERFMRPVPDPVVEDIAVSVYSERGLRGTIHRTGHGGSPVRTGDKIRLSVTLDRPAFLYVLWIGTDGDLTPIYPWNPGQWELPAVQTAVSELHLPSSPGATWPVKPGESGTETVIAVVADTPITWDPRLETLTLESQIGGHLLPLWFEDGRLVAVPRPGVTRSPDVARHAPIGDVIISNQLEIAERIKSTNFSMFALTVPFDG